jgi:hypothetical protein
LAIATELTAYQVRTGLTWLREVAAADEYLTPLIWTHRDCYRFSTEPGDWIDYERACVRTERTASPG